MGTADLTSSVVPLVLCACSERASEWGMTPGPQIQLAV